MADGSGYPAVVAKKKKAAEDAAQADTVFRDTLKGNLNDEEATEVRPMSAPEYFAGARERLEAAIQRNASYLFMAAERVRLIEDPPLPEEELDDLRAKLDEVLSLADALVISSNESWRTGQLDPFLMRVLESITKRDQGTRAVIRLLSAFDEYARLLRRHTARSLAQDIAERVGYFDARAGRRAASATGLSAIEDALTEWPKGRGARNKWATIATAIRVVLKRRVTASSLKKFWARVGPKRVP